MKSATAFAGMSMIARGSLLEVALAVKEALPSAATVLVFDDETGRVVDLDTRGDAAAIAERLEQASAARRTPEPRGRGRPKLGVVAREVTLLPRHWDWLAAQPGGTSQALRRLVEQARLADGGATRRRTAQEAAYRFMSAIAGDLPGFEEATRALFAGNLEEMAARMADWPDDIRAYARTLASGAEPAPAS